MFNHPVARVKGLGFILWQSRHMMYHIMLGLLWAWILREIWNELNVWYIFLSVFGSILPDADHFWYFFTYGRKSPYTNDIKELIKAREWRRLFQYVSQGHKYNTNLSLHNIYIVILIFSLSLLSIFVDWKAGATLFGAILSHYIFDIFDDLVILGQINSNWKRWGRSKIEQV